MGGLVAALDLARQGLRVTVLERGDSPGGKLRQESLNGVRIDAGPTVFTMRPVFEEIFSDAGACLSDHLKLHRIEVLARHAWNGRDRLDLFADRARSADAIGMLAGAAEARGYLAFCAQARQIFETLENSFIRARQPTPLSLVRHSGLRGLGGLWRISPFASMWKIVGNHFADPRLRQLFGRYATYSGSSPFQAPATLMLIAHVEQGGVWRVEGGMKQVASALAGLAASHGVVFRYGADVATIEAQGGRAAGVRLATGERIAADAVVVNADAAAVSGGNFGPAVQRAVAPAAAGGRSLSALTWAIAAPAHGFPLAHHNVFFGADYAGEFEDIFRSGRLPRQPTVYVCAQDRDDSAVAPGVAERLFCIVNAPAAGDRRAFTGGELERCERAAFGLLRRCGLAVERRRQNTVRTDPVEYHRRFPATGGALYGQAVHGAMAAFRRPGARTRMPGLYLAGGSTHPGAGLPMAALSGRMAAATLIEDLGIGGLTCAR